MEGCLFVATVVFCVPGMKDCEMKTPKWELKMNKQRELKRQGAALLFQRVKLLVECYESAEFLQWCEDNSVVDLDYLDNELADAAASFLTLKAVYSAYGKESDWTGRNVRELIAEVLEKQKRTKVSERVSWKERCLEAEKECERLRAELTKVQSLLATSGYGSQMAIAG